MLYQKDSVLCNGYDNGGKKVFIYIYIYIYSIIFIIIINYHHLISKIGSTRKIGMMFDDLLPRLNATKEDIIMWLEALAEKKEQAIEQGDQQFISMQEYINSQSLCIDSIDELINDCLTINFDLNRVMTDINSIVSLMLKFLI